MPKFGGYLPLRRGIFEHTRDGRLTHMEALAYIYMASQADTRTGVWIGSSGALAGELGLKERTARHLIESLSETRDQGAPYIKRFPTPGKHFCYPILINKYLVTDGEHTGERLNATASSSWNLLVFDKNGDSCEHDGEHDGKQDGKHMAGQKRIENREQRTEKKTAAAPPADSRFQPFFGYAHESFRCKHNLPPAWGEKDGAALKALLGKLPAVDVTLGELTRRWDNFVASTEPFQVKQGDSLAHFCWHFDSFISGPILAPSNGAKGGNRAEQRTRDNLRAAGFVQ